MFDRRTWYFVNNLGTFNKDQMKVNADGSIDLYVGPNASAALETTWIPTMGKEPYLWLRLYGPEEAFWDKTFKMPDVELVNQRLIVPSAIPWSAGRPLLGHSSAASRGYR